MIAGINNIQKILSDVLKDLIYQILLKFDIQILKMLMFSAIIWFATQKNPDILEIKKEIISNVKKSQLVKHIEINDQNFININLSDEYLYKFSQNLKKRISHNKINSVIID